MVTIDGHLGMPSTFVARRTRFQTLLAMIGARQGGIVFVRDHMRPARNLLDAARFLDIAQAEAS